MSPLFEKTIIKEMHLKNRFVRSATWEARATPEGWCTDDLIDFTLELAKGGVGLIIMGHAYVLPSGKGTPRQTGIYLNEFVDDLKRIPPGVHRHGSKVALQISHAGGHTKSEWISGSMVAPTTFKNMYAEIAREMSISEIQEIIEAFGDAGKRAKDAGFDAVQIHAAHAYLVNQFLSPTWNHRTDSYGGSTENRARFLFEIYGAIRKRVGGNFPVFVKLTSGDFIKNGFTIDESIWVAKRLSDMGIDAIEVSGGSRYSGSGHIHTNIKSEKYEAYFAENARKIKEEIDVPVILVGGVRSWEVAEKIVEGQKADYIAMSRPFICEPGLVNRWKSGDLSKSRCISDNRCLGPAYEGMEVCCQVKKAKTR